MRTAKSTGMGIGPLQHLAGTDAATGITFSATESITTRLGISLSTDADAAARSLYADIRHQYRHVSLLHATQNREKKAKAKWM